MSTKTPNGLDKLGLKDIGDVYYNLSYDELQAHEVKAVRVSDLYIRHSNV